MAQIKAQDVNWLDQAWRIGGVIANMPDNPPGLLSASRKWPPLTGKTKLLIELLQDTIALHLAYRAKVVHKASITLPDGDKAMFWLQSRDPATTAKAMAFLVKIGVKLQSVDLWAYAAHIKLGRILIDRYVCKEWKRELPLIVASIGGVTTSQTAKLNSRQPRNIDRRSTLARGISNERRQDPTATAWEVLNRLCGGDVVKEHKDGRVWYWNKKDTLTSVGLDRFETIFSEQRPSTG